MANNKWRNLATHLRDKELSKIRGTKANICHIIRTRDMTEDQKREYTKHRQVENEKNAKENCYGREYTRISFRLPQEELRNVICNYLATIRDDAHFLHLQLVLKHGDEFFNIETAKRRFLFKSCKYVEGSVPVTIRKDVLDLNEVMQRIALYYVRRVIIARLMPFRYIYLYDESMPEKGESKSVFSGDVSPVIVNCPQAPSAVLSRMPVDSKGMRDGIEDRFFFAADPEIPLARRYWVRGEQVNKKVFDAEFWKVIDFALPLELVSIITVF